MRKTQMALAAVALVASTAALADGVNIYGTIDAAVVSNGSGSAFAGAGNSAGTIFGFKGSEDLGSGLKAGFNLESGVNAANGSTGANGGVGTSTFNRQANVFVSMEAVTVTLGTQISPFIAATLGGATAVGGNGVFVPGLIRAFGGTLANVGVGSDKTGTTNGGFFVQDAISANVSAGGINASGMYRLVNSAGSANNSDYSAASVGTSIGGLNVALAYQQVGAATAGTNTNPATAATTTATNIALAGNVELGSVRLNAVYSDNKMNGTKKNGYLLGASMPLAAGISGGLTYASNNSYAQGSQTSLSLQYDLSKKTYVYLNHSMFSKETGGAGAAGGNVANDNAGLAASKAFTAIGIAHSF